MTKRRASQGPGRRLASVVGIAALLAAGPARAAVIENCGDLDLDVAECSDFSDDGFLEFDLSLLTAADVELVIQTTTGERSDDSLVLRGFVFNDSFLADVVAFTRVELRLGGGARFVPVGSVRNFDFEAVPVTRPDDVTAVIEPAPPLPAFDLLEIGAADPSEPGATDWEIDLAQLAETSFTLRVISVPEPGALASAALAFTVLAALARRRPS